MVCTAVFHFSVRNAPALPAAFAKTLNASAESDCGRDVWNSRAAVCSQGRDAVRLLFLIVYSASAYG